MTDIRDYKWNDTEISVCYTGNSTDKYGKSEEIIALEINGEFPMINKEDSIVMAQHFKVTKYDLEI